MPKIVSNSFENFFEKEAAKRVKWQVRLFKIKEID